MNRLYLLTLFLIMFLISCNNEDGNIPPAENVPDNKDVSWNPDVTGGDSDISRYYIGAYFSPDKLSLYPEILDCGKLNICVNIPGEFIYKDNEEISKKVGDTCYNKPHDSYIKHALNDSISAIQLLCDEDYDANHPAGTPLNDIAKFYCHSSISFVQSGYQQALPSSDDQLIGEGGIIRGDNKCTAWVMDVDKLDESKTAYIDHLNYIVISHLPEKPGQYCFTVRITFSNNTLEQKCIFDYK